MVDGRRRAAVLTAQDETKHGTSHSFKYIQLTAQEIEQLPPQEQIAAAIEFRQLLQISMGILYTPHVGLTVQAVACNLVFTQAEQRVQQRLPVLCQKVMPHCHKDTKAAKV